MAEAGLDAIVATAPANVTYFTGFHSWADAALKQYMVEPGASADPASLRFAVLTPGSATAIVLDPFSAVNAADLDDVELRLAGLQAFSGSVTSLFGDPELDRTARTLADQQDDVSPIAALARLLRDRGAAGGRVGLDADWLSPATEREIRVALPDADVRGCSNFLCYLRAVKSDQELALLERAAAINEAAASVALTGAADGEAIQDIGRLFRRELVDAGAEFEHFLFGVRGLGAATETRYRLQANDVVLVDFGCVASQYFADTGLTIAMNDPEPDVVDAYAALWDTVAAGMTSIRPGARASDVHRTMCEVVVQEGLTAVSPEGHGIGLEMRDYPIIAPPNGRDLADECFSVDADLTLEPGMVINLEAAQFRPGTASLQCERSFVVTTTGVRDLIPQDRDRIRVNSSGDR